jgi:DNA repair protein RecN (Recombination protein N)
MVNDRMVTVATLKRLGEVLVDLHGQHDHQSLLDPRTHLRFLDGFGDVKNQRERTAGAFRAYAEAAGKLKRLDEEMRTAQERRELYGYQLKELQDADIKAGEDDALEQEARVLQHAEQLIQIASSAYDGLSHEEGAVVDVLAQIIRSLEDIERIDPSIGEALNGARSARYYLDDVAGFLRDYRDRVEFDPERLLEVQDRLNMIRQLKRKYNGDLEEICAYRDRIAAELEQFESADDRRMTLKSEMAQARDTFSQEAQVLSRHRRRMASRLETKIKEELAELGMEKTQFETRVIWKEDSAGPVLVEGVAYDGNETGMDQVEFLISPNPGEELKPLSSIASGGEISRVMLALKAILSESDRMPILVFDEIDIGIGGRVAEAVGQKLKGLARTRQVLCITHLHQVACWGDAHFTVIKRSTKGRTVTQINPLDDDGRVREIARMMAGETIDDLAVTHARAMLRRASRMESAPVKTGP